MCPGDWAFLAGMLVLGLLAASCAQSGDGGTPAQPAAPVTTSPTSMPSVQEGQDKDGGGEERPPVPRELMFTAPALSGGTIRGADYAGKDLVIWFWAPW